MRMLRCPSALALGLLVATAPSVRAAQQGLYCDTAEYAPFKLTWTTCSDLKQVSAVFPHPLVMQRAIAATGDGLEITGDSGRTWKKLPGASVAKVGIVRDIAYHPIQPDTFYLASATNGIWVTNDNGATFKQVGTTAKGLASDSVAKLIFYPGDPSRHTLLAVHGDAAAGISRSRDDGQTWQVFNQEYHFKRIQGGGGNSQEIFMIGYTSKEPDVQNFYSSNTIGEFPIEVIRDIVPTDITRAREKGGLIYISTTDNGVYTVADSGGGISHDVKQLPAKGGTSWTSIATTWGPNADVARIFLYDPSSAGLVSTDNNLESMQKVGGLPVSPLVKEGSSVRPNSNGEVIYAVVNSALSVGRTADDVPKVETAPAVFKLLGTEDDMVDYVRDQFQQFYLTTDFSRGAGSIAAASKELLLNAGDLVAPYENSKLTITARLSLQPAPPSSVTVDLSRYGGSPQTPMYDDGQHGDGQAGDGVYSLAFSFQPQNRPAPANEWRASWPGPVAMGVTATYPDGRHTGAVAVVGAYRLLKDFSLWNRTASDINARTDGSIEARPVFNPPNEHKGGAALRLEANKGEWTVSFSLTRSMQDLTSYGAFTFWIKAANGEPPKELHLQLQDEPEFSEPTTTAPVMIPNVSIGKEYQRIVAPLGEALTSSPQFQTGRVRKIIISGKSDGPVTLYLDGPAVLASAGDDSDSDNEGSKK